AVNCEAPRDGEPCLACASCRAVEQGSHLDVIEVDAASNRGIDEVRDIKERLQHAPVMGSRKVYIIDEVHMLSQEAANALLKTLEEPPPHILFVLATTDPQKLPATVLSRCQRFAFRRLPVSLIVSRLEGVLEREGVAFDREALETVAEAADGGLRDALSLLDQVLAMDPAGEARLATTRELVGSLDGTTLEQVLRAMAAADAPGLMAALEAAYAQGRDPRQILRDVARQLRDVIVYHQVGEAALPAHRRERAAGLAAAGWRHPREPGRWFGALERLAAAEDRLRGSFPAPLVLELALFQAMEMLSGEPPASGTATTGRPVQEAGRTERPRVAAEGPSGATAAVPAAAPGPPESDRWERLVAYLHRKRKLPVVSLLAEARVSEEAGTLVVTLAYPTWVEQMTGSKLAAFQEALRAAYGPEWQVRFQPPGGESPTMEAGNPRPGDDELLRRVREVFGPEVRVEGFGPGGDAG
ncbi:MAG: DNA polymerase III subunit gamma/tau, partial [Firmicutes bacterium]|nr:DNA polymerase III subunit gamma/tau [Bacillota bacterium]